MSKSSTFYDTVDQIVSYGIDKGILHLYTSDDTLNGTELIVNNRKVINFGSCSYLGLEFDPRIKNAAKEAIEKYGTQFSASRAYISIGLYKELEQLLEKIFEASCVIVPTTTLGHIANIPVLVDDTDAVIMDQQVHNSVQSAVQLVKARGVHIELVRHNRMDLLEARIKELRSKHKKIWYMADGIYSMFGDCSPVDEVYSLMDKYPEVYYYVDDAHGMCIHGKHGRGFILSKHQIHPKMAMATSLNKAFACGGGVLIYGDKEMARKVSTVGGPLLSSGPMQPSALGAAIATAKIHLNDEIIDIQEQLHDNIRFTNLMLEKYKLPVISKAGAAIFFIGVSLPKLGHTLVKQMMDAGYYVNLGVFPTVPMKQTGVRFTITRLHTFKEIENMIATLADIFPAAMQKENITLSEIYKAFKLPVPEHLQLNTTVRSAVKQAFELKLFHYKTIKDLDKASWDELFGNKGTFDWNGLHLLEQSFTANELPEDNWNFDYLIVKDNAGHMIVATFLTTTLYKDDMLSPAAISKQIEIERTKNFYYLTSKVISSGSLITEGEHLYIDFKSPCWKNAMLLFFEKIYELQDLYKANNILIRDFYNIDRELDDLMVDNGFFRITMPDSFAIPELPWHSEEEFYNSLSANNRNHLRKHVLRNSLAFEVEIINVTDWQDEIEYWHNLYLNVKNKSLELNTFTLPLKLFYAIAKDEQWQMLQLTLRDNSLQKDEKPCCIIFSYKTKNSYIPMIIGMDYTHNKELGVYRQALYQVVLQAKREGKNKISLGFSAGTEKHKLGAKGTPVYAYMHTKDSYNMEAISAISAVSNFPAS